MECNQILLIIVYISIIVRCEVLNLFHPELKIKDTESAVENKIKRIVKLKKFKVQTVLFLGYKKRNDRKIHQSIITKIKKLCLRRLYCLDSMIKHSIKIF